MKVTVDVQSAQADGAQLRAVLVTTTDRGVVAVSAGDARLQGGRAVFVMRDPALADGAREAVLDPCHYLLYVFVNDDLDFDAQSGDPVYSSGVDRGAISCS